MSTEKRIWDLVTKKLSGEAAEEELKELERLLREHSDLHYPLQQVADLWHHKLPPDMNAYEAFDRHAQRMKSGGIDFAVPNEPAEPAPADDTAGGSRVKMRRRLYAAAALVAVAVITVIYFLWPTPRPENIAPRQLADRSEVSTKYGSKTKLVLPDGTQVWLNSGSKLTYDKLYGNTIREVQLTGEAYFDVVKNAARPFVIHAPGFNIKVLGTAFNVRSFPGEKKSETSLIRGSIEVTFNDRPTEKIILKPNEKLVIANEDIPAVRPRPAAMPAKALLQQDPLVAVSHLTYQPADSTIVETSWMENKLIFRSEPFEDLAVRMERWYGISIRFTNEELKKKKFTGVFESETVQQALKALQYSWPFRFAMNKNEIVLSK